MFLCCCLLCSWCSCYIVVFAIPLFVAVCVLSFFSDSLLISLSLFWTVNSISTSTLLHRENRYCQPKCGVINIKIHYAASCIYNTVIMSINDNKTTNDAQKILKILFWFGLKSMQWYPPSLLMVYRLSTHETFNAILCRILFDRSVFVRPFFCSFAEVRTYF